MRTRPLLILVLLCGASSAHAGMVSFDLNDVIRLRLQEISFFIVALLACALGMMFLWNYAFKEFERMPRLSYGRALAFTALLGVLMVLVLSMISGARELLTPGAWHRQGIGYKLADANDEMRRRSLQQLRASLFAYAATNGGSFPAHDFVAGIPEKLWEAPDKDGTRYVYVGGWTTATTNALIACEPLGFGQNRLVLLGSGEIRRMSTDEIRKTIGAKEGR